MIQAHLQLVCDQDHGIEVSFPEESYFTGHRLQLLALSKKAGWRRHGGLDYCPDCQRFYVSEYHKAQRRKRIST